MISSHYEDLIKRLNPQQLKAVEAIEGAVMVIAGPGTGKTQILTLRIAYILAHTQVNPENILALTFTESAVYEMRKRLVSIIGNAGYRVEINTFHGFCNDIIQKYPEYFENLVSSESITELEQVEMLERIINEQSLEYLKPIGNPLYYVKPALSAINDLKKEGVTVEMFREALIAFENDFNSADDRFYDSGPYKGKMKGIYQESQKNVNKNKELLILYDNYQTELFHKREYDFNDMLLEVIKVLESTPELLLILQEKYQYFLVDEHQDTNAAQNKIVELLSSYFPNPNLFVVGDEKQAIFRFQGASLENFLYFKELYKDAVLINLVHNYRSTQSILNAASSVIANNKVALSENNILQSQGKNTEERIHVMWFHDYFTEYFYIAKKIKEQIEKGVDPCEIAILVRNNRDIEPLADAFEKTRIPYIVEADENILDDLDVSKMILLLKTVSQLGTDLDLIQAMHIDSLGIYPLDIYKLVNHAKEKKISVYQLLQEKEILDSLQLKDLQAILHFVSLLEQWKTKSENNSLDDVFVTVLKESKLQEYILNKKNAIDILDKITVLYGQIKMQLAKKHTYNLSDFLQYIDLLKAHQLYIKKSPLIAHKSAVRLMTSHKSKGLEFDYVYIPQAFDGHWGNMRKRSQLFTLPWEYLTLRFNKVLQTDLNEDERRLFYVALTRARKEIFISYSVASLEGKEQVPTQFLEEIIPEYKEVEKTESFEDEFLLHKEKILLSKDITSKEIVDREYKDNKQFFVDLFLRRGLSVSGLNNYLQCPWRYFFRNLLVLPEVKDKGAVFGSAVHKALNMYLSSKDVNRRNEQLLLDEFNKELLNSALDSRDLNILLKTGKETLSGFYKNVVVNWKQTMQSELSIRGIKLSDKVFLNGRIDMIEPLDKSAVIVHDFKTTKPKSRGFIEGATKGSTGDYKRQLVFYKILLDRFHNNKLKMEQGVIDFVEPTEKGVYKSEAFIIQDKEVEELEERIIHIADEIMTLSFWDTHCDDNECEYCNLRRLVGR
jgi:DNA helicase-2/ATP-dependent DNA helicase PcrA